MQWNTRNDDLLAYCRMIGHVGSQYYSCDDNSMKELDPVTCTCCIIKDSGNFWNCNNTCCSSSNYHDVGFPISTDTCQTGDCIICNGNQLQDGDDYELKMSLVEGKPLAIALYSISLIHV